MFRRLRRLTWYLPECKYWNVSRVRQIKSCTNLVSSSPSFQSWRSGICRCRLSYCVSAALKVKKIAGFPRQSMKADNSRDRRFQNGRVPLMLPAQRTTLFKKCRDPFSMFSRNCSTVTGWPKCLLITHLERALLSSLSQMLKTAYRKRSWRAKRPSWYRNRC